MSISRKSPHVLIVGGGIGGLCLAQALRKSGVSAAVFERDRSRTDRLQGYRIHIDPQGSQALHECLPDTLFKTFDATCGGASHAFNYVNENLEPLLRLDLSAANEATDPIARHRSVSRITLRRILLEGLDDAVHFDKRFSRYETSPDGRVVAYFDDGTAAAGDLLIGADGGNSQVRKQLLPRAERRDTGIVGVAGKVPLTPETREWIPRPLLEGPMFVKAPHGRAMFSAPLIYPGAERAAIREFFGDEALPAGPEGSLWDNLSDYVFWSFSTRNESFPPGRRPGEVQGEDLRAEVLEMVAAWHPNLRRLIREAVPDTILSLPIRTSVRVEPWETSRVTLLGDAIHSMTPYRGIGANIALRDAALLGRNLAAAHRGEITMERAVDEYEAQMLDYGFEAVESSLRAMEQVHAEGVFAEAVGKTVLRAINAVPMLKRRMLRSPT